tara:strand:- start:103 stop:381 length:279 start_codon:yes stop_codon:yes gene_type:complete
MTDNNLKDILDNIEQRMFMLSTIQMTIVTHLTDKDKDLMRKIMASVFSVDDFRNDFTDFINEEGNDRVKTFMMDINENIEAFKKKLEDDDDS